MHYIKSFEAAMCWAPKDAHWYMANKLPHQMGINGEEKAKNMSLIAIPLLRFCTSISYGMYRTVTNEIVQKKSKVVVELYELVEHARTRLNKLAGKGAIAVCARQW